MGCENYKLFQWLFTELQTPSVFIHYINSDAGMADVSIYVLTTVPVLQFADAFFIFNFTVLVTSKSDIIIMIMVIIIIIFNWYFVRKPYS